MSTPISRHATATDPTSDVADNISTADDKTSTGGESGRKIAPSMDPALTTIQPGGGVVMSIELAWGSLRRSYLNRFRRGFVERMEITRQGTRGTIPFVPVDPRDIKYYRNQDTHWWAEADDPFAWRDSLPFVRAGLAELVLIAGGFLLLALLAGWFCNHSYRAPMCQTFVTLPNLQTALGDTGRYPSGTGVCLNRFSTAGVPDAQTSVPGK